MSQTFNIDVAVDPRGAVAGSRRVGTALRGATRHADRFRSVLRNAFLTLTAGAGVVQITRTLARFEQSMSSVRAVTQATDREFAALRMTASQLGATTRFSATQAGEAMLFLGRAGFETDEILSSVGGTLSLAQAGALELGTAADIASNILTGFRLEVEETGRVVDVLAAASNSANTSVQQMGEAMKFVAPVAAGLGVSIEEAAAAVGVLSDAGLQGSLAGTGLRRVLSELESPANKTIEIFDALGVSADQVRISQVGLTEAIRVLAEAGLDTGLALEVFGDRGGPAFEVLSNGSRRVRELTGELRNAEGTAERMAEIMDNNLNGALFRVNSAWEALTLALGDAGFTQNAVSGLDLLSAALRGVADNIRELDALLDPTRTTTRAEESLADAQARVERAQAALEETQRNADAGSIELSLRRADLASAQGRLVERELAVQGQEQALLARANELRGQLEVLGRGTFVSQAIEDQLADVEEDLRILQQRRDDVARALDQRIGGDQPERPEPEAVASGADRVRERADAGAEAVANLERELALFHDTSRAAEARYETELGSLRDIDQAYKDQLVSLAEQLDHREELANSIMDETEAERERAQEHERATQRIQQAADRISDPFERARRSIEQWRRDQLAALDQTSEDYELFAELVEMIYEERIATAAERAAMRQLRASTDLRDGFLRAFMDIEAESLDLASVAENTVTRAFQGMEDALVSFATTGKLEIGDLVDSIVADFARLAIRSTITGPLAGALGSSLGGGGFDLGGLFGFRQGGLIGGVGSGTSDSNIIRASRGEYVVNAAATRAYLPLLERVNNARRFQQGGLVGAPAGVSGGVFAAPEVNVEVQVVDQRGAEAPTPEVEHQPQAGRDGRDVIRITIRDAVREGLSSGEFDGSFQRRYGIRPTLA